MKKLKLIGVDIIEQEETDDVDDSDTFEDEIDQDNESNNGDENDEVHSDDSEDGDENFKVGNNSDSNVSNKQNPTNNTELEIKKIYQKYKDRQGKQLYIRFPSRLPEDEEEFQQKAKALSPLIIKAHKPRQKYARFCLVDFKTKEDRDTAFANIRKSRKNEDFKGIRAELPRTEKDEFVEKLADRKLKSLENKKAKKRLKLESKRAERNKNHTASIVIVNLPKTTSVLELRKVIPDAVDIYIKPKCGLNGASIATITLSSTSNARSAVRRHLTIGGTKLITRFDKRTLKPKYQSRKSTTLEKSKRTKEESIDFLPIKRQSRTHLNNTSKTKRTKTN